VDIARPDDLGPGTGVAARIASSSSHKERAMQTLPPAAVSAGTPLEGTRAIEDAASIGPGLLSASTLTGNNVVNPAGDTLGEIEEIMLDVQRGRIAYVVMASGGFLGIGEKLFAIPWNALVLDTDRRVFVLDVDKEHFKTAPGFEKAHWPTQLNGGEAWHRDLHAFYRTQVYWEKS
jgi:sporulation protein YlmC with PRC-barrel domain